MHRAEWPDRADSASPPLDVPDSTIPTDATEAEAAVQAPDAVAAVQATDATDALAAAGATTSVDAADAPAAAGSEEGDLNRDDSPTAGADVQPAQGAASPAEKLRPIIRVVGAPPEPEAVREPADVALRALRIAGVDRRRVGWIIGAVISVWIVAVFARQVGEASAAATRADHVRSQNAAIATQVAALQRERDVVQERSFVEFQARKWGLGNAQDQRFTLAQNAPPLPSHAPGSASVRLAPEPTPQTPLEAWLSLLFGPSR